MLGRVLLFALGVGTGLILAGVVLMAYAVRGLSDGPTPPLDGDD